MANRLCDAVLVLVIGLPAAGKTTFVKTLAAKDRSGLRLYDHISFDDLYRQMAGEDANSQLVDFDPKRWKFCQREMAVLVSKRLQEQNELVKRDKNTPQLVLLVDDNFQYRTLRKRFFQLADERKNLFFLLCMRLKHNVTNKLSTTHRTFRVRSIIRQRS